MAQAPFQRIGHGGASALVAANTLASFDVAREIGVEMIEFDVRAGGVELVLAHTVLHARRGTPVTLRRALAHLAGQCFADVELNVDVKHVGCEPVLLAELERQGLLERTLISSQVPAVLAKVRALDSRVRIGISVGGRVARVSRGWRGWRGAVLDGLARGRWDAVMLQHRLVGAPLLEEVLDRRGRLYAWTVNERSAIERLRTLGVHGITTADPRLFSEAATRREVCVFAGHGMGRGSP